MMKDPRIQIPHDKLTLKALERILLYSKVLTKKDFWREYEGNHPELKSEYKLYTARVLDIFIRSNKNYLCLLGHPSSKTIVRELEVTANEIKNYLTHK
ncbi:MAG: hypothetical protein PHD81_01565 [Candidatus Nanoarchaeia archaeon]|nr:hypothetical protein [Candidatus Nanoarchaeia archaeon]MDD5587776.1 hypothetical protein [Candidatus Nanoarchaeia archaeon]